MKITVTIKYEHEGNSQEVTRTTSPDDQRFPPEAFLYTFMDCAKQFKPLWDVNYILKHGVNDA